MAQTNQADPELPYLSDLLQPEQFKHGRFNLVVAPCHSGKSTAARTLITDFGFPRESVLYLIDTTAGKEAILAHEKAQTLPYEWIEHSEPFRRIHNMYTRKTSPCPVQQAAPSPLRLSDTPCLSAGEAAF